jgi:hypothetical protein
MKLPKSVSACGAFLIASGCGLRLAPLALLLLIDGCATASGTLRYQLAVFPKQVKDTVPMRTCEATVKRDDSGAWTVSWAAFTDTGKVSGLFDYSSTLLQVNIGSDATATLYWADQDDPTGGVSVELSAQNCQHFAVNGSVDTHNKVHVRVELKCHVRPDEWVTGNASSDDCIASGR